MQQACLLADAEGFGAVTLSSVAAGLGVATSALYNHCAGLDSLHHQVAVASTVLVYTGMGFDPEQCRFAARSTISAIHGFLALEHSAPSPTGDADFQHLITTLRRGLVSDP